MFLQGIQEDILLWFQNNTSHTLDSVFYVITELGDVTFYLIMLTFLYWNISKKVSVRLVVIMTLSVGVNTILKNTLKNLRPFYSEKFTKGINKEVSGYAFPSGHSQNSAACFSGLYMNFKKKWVLAISLLFIILVPISRLYFRVHWPQDVIVGIILGVGIAMIYDKFLATKLETLLFSTPIMLYVTPLLFITTFFIEDSDVHKAFGALTGALIGLYFEIRALNFDEKSSVKLIVLRQVLGLLILLVIKSGLKMILPSTNYFEFFRYFILGGFITYLGPIIFIKLGWMKRSQQ